jgi:hypothetical protein
MALIYSSHTSNAAELASVNTNARMDEYALIDNG